MTQMWRPLESNPEVFTEFINKLDATTSLYFQDIFGPEVETFPDPTHHPLAIIFLFELNDKICSRYADDSLKIVNPDTDQVWFMKQTVGNACGTVAIVHALMNVPEPFRCPKLTNELASTTHITRGRAFETSTGSAHHAMANKGATALPPTGDVAEHFVTFVPCNGRLWELDGRMAGPIDHGPLDETQSWCQLAFTKIRDVMQRDPNSWKFTLLGLWAKQ